MAQQARITENHWRQTITDELRTNGDMTERVDGDLLDLGDGGSTKVVGSNNRVWREDSGREMFCGVLGQGEFHIVVTSRIRHRQGVSPLQNATQKLLNSVSPCCLAV